MKDPAARGGKRPTARDVARLADVSIGTVSRVLNQVPQVRREIRERVDGAIRELGFVPNGVAQSLRSRSSRAIAYIVPDIAQPLFAQHVGGAEVALRQLGYALMLMNTYGDIGRERDALSLVEKRSIDGVIISTSREDDAGLVTRLQSIDIPVVLLERDVPSLDCVLAGHRDGTRRGAGYLLGLGHRRIALITVTTANWPGRERLAGMTEAYAEHGLSPPHEIMSFDGISADYGYLSARQMLDGDDPPTAFIVGGNQIIGVMKAIRQTGLQIPRDISVICLGDTDFLEVFDPPITTIRWDLAGLGRMAAEIMGKRLLDAKHAPARAILPVDLVLRHSCARPSPRKRRAKASS